MILEPLSKTIDFEALKFLALAVMAFILYWKAYRSILFLLKYETQQSKNQKIGLIGALVFITAVLFVFDYMFILSQDGKPSIGVSIGTTFVYWLFAHSTKFSFRSDYFRPAFDENKKNNLKPYPFKLVEHVRTNKLGTYPRITVFNSQHEVLFDSSDLEIIMKSFNLTKENFGPQFNLL